MDLAMDRRALALLTAGHLSCDLSQGALPAFLPFLVTERHLSYAAAGSVLFAANIVSSFVQPLVGLFADRRPAAWVMPVGLLLAGGGLALVGLMPTYALLAVAAAISGIGIAAFHPEAARLVRHTGGERRATGMTIFALGGSGGFALGPLLATLALVAFGLRGGVLLIVPAAIIASAFLRALPHFASGQILASGAAAAAYEAAPDAWGPFARLTVAVLCRSVVFYGLNTFLPLYWIVVFHQSKSAGGAALTLLLVGGVGGTLVGGPLADRYNRRLVVAAAWIALAPLLLAFVAAGTVGVATALLIPLGVVLSIPFSVMVVMGQEYVPRHLGLASGVTLGLAVSGGGLAAPLLGHIADQYGLHTALVGLAVVPLLAIGLVLTLPRTERARRKTC